MSVVKRVEILTTISAGNQIIKEETAIFSSRFSLQFDLLLLCFFSLLQVIFWHQNGLMKIEYFNFGWQNLKKYRLQAY